MRYVSGTFRKKTPAFLIKINDTIAIDIEERIEMKEFYNEERTLILENIRDEEIKPPILKSEVENPVKLGKLRKAAGPNIIPNEVIRLLDDHNKEKLTHLFNIIYSTGIIPKNGQHPNSLHYPKKPTANKCNDYGIISRMSQFFKTFLRIIHARIRRKCEQNIDGWQLGFQARIWYEGRSLSCHHTPSEVSRPKEGCFPLIFKMCDIKN